MNERIKEILKLCNGIHYDDDNNEITPMLVGYDNIEQFAKLLIQECVVVHIDCYGGDIISSDLKEHFGV